MLVGILYAHIEVVVKFFRVFSKDLFLKCWFSLFFEVPGGFRKLREAYRIRFHLPWYPSDPVVTSYDQKTKKVNE